MIKADIKFVSSAKEKICLILFYLAQQYIFEPHKGDCWYLYLTFSIFSNQVTMSILIIINLIVFHMHYFTEQRVKTRLMVCEIHLVWFITYMFSVAHAQIVTNWNSWFTYPRLKKGNVTLFIPKFASLVIQNKACWEGVHDCLSFFFIYIGLKKTHLETTGQQHKINLPPRSQTKLNDIPWFFIV